MNIQARRLAMVAAMLWFGFGVGGRAQAALALPTPAGLKNDQPFRFVFVTDGTINAFSDDIVDYNSFASSQAANATYNGKKIAWTAIASTTAKNAKDNIPGDQTAPVYLPKGQLIATNTTTGKGGLWSTGPNITLMNAINQDVFGQPPTATIPLVWTGTKRLSGNFFL